MSTANERQGATRHKLTKRELERRKRRNIVLMIIEVVVLLALIGLCVYLFSGLGIGGGSTGDGGSTANPFTTKVQDEDGIPQGANEDVVEQMTEEDNPMKDYTLIALFGVDSRSENLEAGDNRSDTIMIAAINNTTKDVKLMSVYRDTYLNVEPDDDVADYYCKCNTAYALGGYKQAVATLNSNLDLYIEDYVTIGFSGLIDTIDALGGIYIDVDDSEIKHLNNYQICMAEELNIEYKEVTQTGYQLLSGIQATAYCRIRYTAGNDYKRTERQREVVMAILQEAKKASFTELTAAAKSIIKQVSTSLTLDEILDILKVISEYDISAQAGFPEDNMRTSGTIGNKGSCVIPVSLASNVKWLHEFMFDDSDYVVSSKVQSYSDTIYSQVYPYLGDLVNE